MHVKAYKNGLVAATIRIEYAVTVDDLVNALGMATGGFTSRLEEFEMANADYLLQKIRAVLHDYGKDIYDWEERKGIELEFEEFHARLLAIVNRAFPEFGKTGHWTRDASGRIVQT